MFDLLFVLLLYEASIRREHHQNSKDPSQSKNEENPQVDK